MKILDQKQKHATGHARNGNYMKINKNLLNKIIQEEIKNYLSENELNEDWKGALKKAAAGAAIAGGMMASSPASAHNTQTQQPFISQQENSLKVYDINEKTLKLLKIDKDTAARLNPKINKIIVGDWMDVKNDYDGDTETAKMMSKGDVMEKLQKNNIDPRDAGMYELMYNFKGHPADPDAVQVIYVISVQ